MAHAEPEFERKADSITVGPELAEVDSATSGQRSAAAEYTNTKRCAACNEQKCDCIRQLHHLMVRLSTLCYYALRYC
jgi:hypothetical protein